MLQHAKSFMISFLCVYEYIMHPSIVTIDHHQTRVSFRCQQQRTTFQWSLTAEMLAGEERLSVCVINLYPSLWAIKHDYTHVSYMYMPFFCFRFPEDSLYLSEETWRMIRIGEGPLGFGMSRSLSLPLDHPTQLHIQTFIPNSSAPLIRHWQQPLITRYVMQEFLKLPSKNLLMLRRDVLPIEAFSC